jgi:hypothetical protein
MLRLSISLSLLFFSLRCILRCSFSNNRAHQPAKASHFCAKTLSITPSILTPELRILCKQSFSKGVEKGGGC